MPADPPVMTATFPSRRPRRGAEAAEAAAAEKRRRLTATPAAGARTIIVALGATAHARRASRMSDMFVCLMSAADDALGQLKSQRPVALFSAFSAEISSDSSFGG
jgi:hypothetical protein